VAWEMSPTDWRWLASVSFADFRKFVGSEAGDIAVESLAGCRVRERDGKNRVVKRGMNIAIGS
jgi:hypothetical protein